jgi:hypothetical protein
MSNKLLRESANSHDSTLSDSCDEQNTSKHDTLSASDEDDIVTFKDLNLGFKKKNCSGRVLYLFLTFDTPCMPFP